MKKTWFIKYLATAIGSIAVAVIFYVAMPKNEYDAYGILLSRGLPWWIPVLIPYFALSLLAAWKIIRRYNVYCFEKIDTGNASYNTVFKLLIVLCGIVILPILLVAGFPLVCIEFYKELMQAIDEKQKEKNKKRNKKEKTVCKKDNTEIEINSADDDVSMMRKICGKKSGSIGFN